MSELERIISDLQTILGSWRTITDSDKLRYKALEKTILRLKEYQRQETLKVHRQEQNSLLIPPRTV